MIDVKVAAIVFTGAVVLSPGLARAQSADPASRFEAGVGIIWVGQQPLGDRAITETTASGAAQTVFSTSSELAGAAGLTARAGVRVTRALAVEGAASYTRPQLRIAASGDTEGAASVMATESVQQFMIGGDVLWYVPERASRIAPFVLAGGGYLRQLHEAATLAETGRYYEVGGGASFLLATERHGHLKGAGVRVDARAVIREKGVAFDDGSKTSPAVAASLFVRF